MFKTEAVEIKSRFFRDSGRLVYEMDLDLREGSYNRPIANARSKFSTKYKQYKVTRRIIVPVLVKRSFSLDFNVVTRNRL